MQKCEMEPLIWASSQLLLPDLIAEVQPVGWARDFAKNAASRNPPETVCRKKSFWKILQVVAKVSFGLPYVPIRARSHKHSGAVMDFGTIQNLKRGNTMKLDWRFFQVARWVGDEFAFAIRIVCLLDNEVVIVEKKFRTAISSVSLKSS